MFKFKSFLLNALQEENGQLAKRLATIEKTLSKDPQQPTDEDYLVKLFAQAYLN